MTYSINAFRPIDIAVGGVIQDAYQNVSTEFMPTGFKSFLERENKRRVYRGRYEDPTEFLAALRKNQEQEISNASGDKLNQSLLPTIYYYRHLNYNISDAGTNPKQVGQNLVVGSKKYSIDTLYFDLSYRIVFLAYDVSSLDALVTAFMMFINFPQRLGEDGIPDDSSCLCSKITNKGFSIQYMNGLESKATFLDKSTLNASRVPVSWEQGRLFAAEISDFGISVGLYRSNIALEEVPMDIRVELIEEPLIHG